MGLAASRQEAFWEACGFGNLERAKRFLEEGDIDVNWVSYTNDCSPIHVASQGKPEIVELLLQHNCDVNVKDIRGNSALHHAAMKGHVDIVQTLIDAGAEVNVQEKNGWTALHNAAYWCHPDVIKVLIANGCDVNLQNKDERTALHECARSRERDEMKLGDIATMLIQAGSDVNAKSSDRGEADLTGLMYAAYHNHPDVASALIKGGCELDAIGSTFWTALHWATDRENDEVVYILLEAGANPMKKGMRGETALDRAQSEEIQEALSTAMELYKELHRINLRESKPIIHVPKPVEKFVPRENNFKSESFLPNDWKPTSNVRNLINEKKSKLAAMTSQQYRAELARRTGGNVIETCEQGAYKISHATELKQMEPMKQVDRDHAADAAKDCLIEDADEVSNGAETSKTEKFDLDPETTTESLEDKQTEPGSLAQGDNADKVMCEDSSTEDEGQNVVAQKTSEVDIDQNEEIIAMPNEPEDSATSACAVNKETLSNQCIMGGVSDADELSADIGKDHQILDACVDKSRTTQLKAIHVDKHADENVVEPVLDVESKTEADCDIVEMSPIQTRPVAVHKIDNISVDKDSAMDKPAMCSTKLELDKNLE